MQLNLGLFSYNNGCGYIEKPLALCQSQSLVSPKIGSKVENIIKHEIQITVLSGQFLCQDREPTLLNVYVNGMYGGIKRRTQFRIRCKQWNGFRAIYTNGDINSDKCTIQLTNIVLPETAALLFSVIADDGSCVGLSFMPISYLRNGYRYVVLRNQLHIPVHSSSLLIHIRRNIYHTDAQDKKIEGKSDKLVMIPPGPIHDRYDDNNFHSTLLIRRHHLSESKQKKRDEELDRPLSLGEMDPYYKHFVAASRFNDEKKLCKVLSLDDITSKLGVTRSQEIDSKLRRVSISYQQVSFRNKSNSKSCMDYSRENFRSHFEISSSNSYHQNSTNFKM